MSITDVFIKRPTLAIVISLFILAFGLRSMIQLSVRQFPFTQNAVVTVTTIYTGADPELIAGFITTPLENSIAQATGIDYLISNSTQGKSTIQANLKLNYDPNKAVSDINTKINAVLHLLPKEAQAPIITVAIGETINAMYIGFYSSILASNQITDYLIRIVQPKLQTIEGVQLAEILGSRQFALRAWLDPDKMAGFSITAQDISHALAANNFTSAVGRTDGSLVTVNLTAKTDLNSIESFRNLILKTKNGAIVRLKDVATVSLGSENYDTSVKFDGASAVYIGIKTTPSANILTTIQTVKTLFPSIAEQLPAGLNGKIVYDGTRYVHSAIREVEHALFEAILIVTLVIFLFLGSMRSVLISVITIPLSLVGAFFIMLLLGYTINLLTLLALVLAIGLVVDDAIIVIENIHRHMEGGMSRMDAALQGARELANPIIAISVVLIAVYIPIGFMEGLTGALFTEFAFTLAGSVAVSAIVALTLSPMMCSKLLKPSTAQHTAGNRFMHYIDGQFEKIQFRYKTLLNHSLNYIPVTCVFSVIILGSIYLLYTSSKSELAPQEDQGILITQLVGAPNANLNQTQLYSTQVYEILKSYSDMDHVFQFEGSSGLNMGITGMVLKNWDERSRTAMQLQPDLQAKLSDIPGIKAVVFQRPPLPGSSGLPIQFVIGSTESFNQLNDVANHFIDKLQSTGLFMYLDSDLKLNKQQATLEFDRDKASQLGLTMQDVGNVLASNLSGNYINFFNLEGRSYKVIPQITRENRLNYQQILNYPINTLNGASIPLSTIAKLKTSIVPESLNHFQQLNAVTILGIPIPGITLGQALDTMKITAKETFPTGYTIDYAGQSRQYEQEGSAWMLTSFFALIIIFLALAALFENFRDPLIVLISVPMSIWGAMIFIALGIGGVSLNIYTQVGLVTLIGLISKHGILIVQFANTLQKAGHTKRAAIELASETRLRPILMTTASIVLGVVPLIMASGAGAVSRFNIGLIIASGISIGTLFTLFVVPALYTLLNHPTEN